MVVQKSGNLPRSSAVSTGLPTAPAASKISRCSTVGKAFHCMMRAAPRQRRMYSSSAARAAPRGWSCSGMRTEPLQASANPRLSSVKKTKPSLQVLNLRVSSALRTLDEFAARGCPWAMLLGCEHAEPSRWLTRTDMDMGRRFE